VSQFVNHHVSWNNGHQSSLIERISCLANRYTKLELVVVFFQTVTESDCSTYSDCLDVNQLRFELVIWVVIINDTYLYFRFTCVPEPVICSFRDDLVANYEGFLGLVNNDVFWINHEFGRA
jgi:hypothetical protein